MIPVRFEVGDAEGRRRFLGEVLPRALAELGVDARPQWGMMTAQEMVEHLVWSIRCSTGVLVLPVSTPAALLERARRFLHDERRTPREFMNPVLKAGLPSLEYPDLAGAVAAVRSEMDRFLAQSRRDPAAVFAHPIFGMLNGEEWERAHFKHCHHHLEQFGLVE